MAKRVDRVVCFNRLFIGIVFLDPQDIQRFYPKTIGRIFSRIRKEEQNQKTQRRASVVIERIYHGIENSGICVSILRNHDFVAVYGVYLRTTTQLYGERAVCDKLFVCNRRFRRNDVRTFDKHFLRDEHIERRQDVRYVKNNAYQSRTTDRMQTAVLRNSIVHIGIRQFFGALHRIVIDCRRNRFRIH